MSLFEQLILQEAVPRKAKELGISPENPPDLTRFNVNDPNAMGDSNQQPSADPSATPQGPANVDPNAGLAQPDQTATVPADDGAAPMDDGSGAVADPNAVAGDGTEMAADGTEMEGDPNADPNADPGMDANADPNALQGPDGVAPEEPDPQQAEQELFKDLKPEQMQIKNRELKERFQDLYMIVSESLDKLNKVSKTSYDAVMLDLALRQLLELKDLIQLSITKAYPTRTYVENKIELQKLATSFNAIANTVANIYEARVKRAMKYSKENGNGPGLDKIDFTQDLGY